jgi:DNA-binding MarR family transcriptional regulator
VSVQGSRATATAEDALITAMLTLGRRMRQRLPGDSFDASLVPVLKTLQSCGPVRHTALAERLQLDASTVSRKVRHLEELGLVQVVPDREDGRARQVELLPGGRQALEQLLAVRRGVIRQVLDRWSPDDRAQLRDLLDRFTSDLDPRADEQVRDGPAAPSPV